MINTKIDYIQLMLYFLDTKELYKEITNLTKICRKSDRIVFQQDKPFYSGIKFSNSFKSINGIYGGYGKGKERNKAIIILPGSYLNFPEDKEKIELTLLKYIYKRRNKNLKITRLDIAIDDYNRRISYSKLKYYVQKGNYTNLISNQCIESKLARCESQEKGYTIYFGSGHSNKSLKFYNAEILHGIKADRWEGTFRREYAEEAIKEIVIKGTNKSSLVTGIINFIDRRNKKLKIDECPQLSFWKSLIRDTEGAINISCKRQLTDLDKILKWIYRQVGPSLAILSEIYKEDFNLIIDELMPDWKERHNISQLKLIELELEKIKKGERKLCTQLQELKKLQ